MRARPNPGGHGPAARCCILFTSGLAHSPNIPYKHTHTCSPNSRRLWPGCLQMSLSCWWPCTFTKHTTQTHNHTHACMHAQFQEITARLPAAAFFLLVALHIHQTYHTNTHACMPNPRRSWPGCSLMRSSCWWPCTFTKFTTQPHKHTHACMHAQFQEVTARLPAAAIFLPVALHIHQTYHTNTQTHTCMHAHPLPGGHGPAARCCVLFTSVLAHSPNVPYKHTHACTPTSRRSWPGCLQRSFLCWWPCTFTKHTT